MLLVLQTIIALSSDCLNCVDEEFCDKRFSVASRAQNYEGPAGSRMNICAKFSNTLICFVPEIAPNPGVRLSVDVIFMSASNKKGLMNMSDWSFQD
jgi:hypothetical protein